MRNDTIEKVCQTMTAMAGRDDFPVHDREWWISYFTDRQVVEQLLTVLADHYYSNDQGMCKLLDIIDEHITKEYE